MKKRLLIATDGFLPRWDGITRFLLELVPKLEDDYEIRILAPKFPGDFNNPFNSEVIRFDLIDVPVADIQFSKVRKKYIKEHIKWADLIFVQSLGSIGMACIKAAKKKPVVCYLHLIEWELATKSIKRFKKLGRILALFFAKHYYKKCDLLICPNEEVAHLYQKKGIMTPKKIISLGTDIDVFVPSDKKQAKEKIGIDPDQVVIGYHGRIGREKDLLTLYRAFRNIEKKFKNVKLLIVGKGVKDVENMFTSDRNIILKGSKEDVVPFLQAMDIYVITSLTETTSLATLEAMSCGLPVIATPAGSIKDYITERENGMIFPFRNSMRLAMKIEVLINDSNLREKLGINARKTVVENFNWQITYEKLRDALFEFSK